MTGMWRLLATTLCTQATEVVGDMCTVQLEPSSSNTRIDLNNKYIKVNKRNKKKYKKKNIRKREE